jgi:peptide-methionine (S)-S-oxide reductase
MNENFEKIYLGGGCFWCLEAVFQRVRGVEKVVSGYSGGNTDIPTYEQVSSGETGHAEVVEITFDKNIVSFESILDIFFDIHDPTSLNKQGNDIGTQYRSIILVTSPDQLALCLKKIAELNSSGKYNTQLVTEIKKFDKFYSAEDYHQNFYINNQNYPYCTVVIDPKLKKFMEHFSQNIK